MITAKTLRSAVLLAGLAVMGATPAFAHHATVDCAVNPANVDCVNAEQPVNAVDATGDDSAIVNPPANPNTSAIWLPQGGDGQKPGHGG